MLTDDEEHELLSLLEAEAFAAVAITRTRTLIVWRRPEDTEHEACARWGIEPAAWGRVVYRLSPQSGRFAAHPEQLRPAFLPGPDEDWTAILTQGHQRLDARRRQCQEAHPSD